MPTRNQKKQIIKELKETALGEAFHGKALRVAKVIFPLTENELETIDAWETGKYSRDSFKYGMRLQDLAIRMHQELENEAEHNPAAPKKANDEELKIFIDSPGDPSVGLFSKTWVIDEVYIDNQEDGAFREELRSAFKNAFELLTNEPVGVYFSDEPSHEPDSEPSGPGM